MQACPARACALLMYQISLTPSLWRATSRDTQITACRGQSLMTLDFARRRFAWTVKPSTAC